MAEKTIQIDSSARAAYDLMHHIAACEEGKETQDRKYWLELYSQCILASHGNSIQSILK